MAPVPLGLSTAFQKLQSKVSVVHRLAVNGSPLQQVQTHSVTKLIACCWGDQGMSRAVPLSKEFSARNPNIPLEGLDVGMNDGVSEIGRAHV